MTQWEELAAGAFGAAIVVRRYFDMASLAIGATSLLSQGRVGAGEQEKQLEGASIIWRNTFAFLLGRWKQIDWPKLAHDVNVSWDQFKAETSMRLSTIWRHTWKDILLIGFIPSFIGRRFSAFAARRQERWRTLWIVFGRWCRLAVGRKHDDALGEMKASQAFLAATPLSPFRFFATAFAITTLLSLGWGGWEKLRGDKAVLRAQKAEAITARAADANEGLAARAVAAEARVAELQTALNAKGASIDKAMADYSHREDARAAKARLAAARTQGKRNVAAGDISGGAEPYFSQWMRERAEGAVQDAAVRPAGANKAGADMAARVLPEIPAEPAEIKSRP